MERHLRISMIARIVMDCMSMLITTITIARRVRALRG